MESDSPEPEEHRGGPARGWRHRRTLLTAGAVVVVAVAAATTWVLWPRGTTAITTEDALADFRDSATGDQADQPDSASPEKNGSGSSGASGAAGSATPEPGVYEYRAEGHQSVKLGPLPAEDRTLPGVVSVVVGEPTDGPGGTECFEWTLNLFEEHTETTTWCTGEDGTLTVASHVKHQAIGALSPTATVECDPGVLIEPGEATTNLDCTFALEGGPISVDAPMSGTATMGPAEELGIGGSTATATPLTVTYEMTSGGVTSTQHTKLWLGENLLPLRIERDLTLDGPASFSESSTLELVAREPVR